MIISQLDDKYKFRRTHIAEIANVSIPRVKKFLRGETGTVKTAAAIINALPITEQERQELINSMFERKTEQ